MRILIDWEHRTVSASTIFLLLSEAIELRDGLTSCIDSATSEAYPPHDHVTDLDDMVEVTVCVYPNENMAQLVDNVGRGMDEKEERDG